MEKSTQLLSTDRKDKLECTRNERGTRGIIEISNRSSAEHSLTKATPANFLFTQHRNEQIHEPMIDIQTKYEHVGTIT